MVTWFIIKRLKCILTFFQVKINTNSDIYLYEPISVQELFSIGISNFHGVADVFFSYLFFKYIESESTKKRWKGNKFYDSLCRKRFLGEILANSYEKHVANGIQVFIIPSIYRASTLNFVTMKRKMSEIMCIVRILLTTCILKVIFCWNASI